MRVSTTLQYAGDPRPFVDAAVRLEGAGLDTIWVAEAYGFDAVSVLGYIAGRTSTVNVGSAVLNIYSRTPTLLAQTAAGLDAVSGGRAVLGLGASGPQVIEGWHGLAYDKPLPRTREVVDIVRRALRREVITNDGQVVIPLPAELGTGLGKPLKMLTRPVRDAVPIYLAALGDRNVRLTAEIADGWLPTMFVPERAADVWGASLAAGAAKRSPDLVPLEVCTGGPLAIGEDVTAMRELMRPLLALYIGGMGAKGRNFYHDTATRLGFGEQADAIQERYLAGAKAEAAALVPDELIQGVSLIGPAGYVRERVEAYRAAGVTKLDVFAIGQDPVGDVAKLVAWAA